MGGGSIKEEGADCVPCVLQGRETAPPVLRKVKEKVKVLVTQLCPTLCNSKDCSPPDSSVHGILQARILEWVAIPFSRGFFQPRDQTWDFCIVGRLLPSESPGKAP